MSPESGKAGHRRRAARIAVATMIACFAATLTPAASAIAAPALSTYSLWGPATMAPGGTGKLQVEARNLGDSATVGQTTLAVQLPPEISRVAPLPADGIVLPGLDRGVVGVGEGLQWTCSGATSVSCHNATTVAARDPEDNLGYYPEPLYLRLKASPEAVPGIYPATVTVSDESGAPPSSEEVDFQIGEEPAGFGMAQGSFRADAFDARYPNGTAVRQAGAHPFEMRVDFKMNEILEEQPAPKPGTRTALFVRPDEELKTVQTTLPTGLIGNPEATPKCSPAKFFSEAGPYLVGTGCPADTQVGEISLDLARFPGGPHFSFIQPSRVPVYNLVPPRGVAADFGYNIANYRGHIYPSLDPGQDYAIKATSPQITSALLVRKIEFTIWGVPADPSHNELRAIPHCPFQANPICQEPDYGAAGDEIARPFLTLPMDCGVESHFRQSVESWQHPGAFTPTALSNGPSMVTEGCEDQRIRFKPDISMQPTSRAAGGPTGLDVHLQMPQRDDATTDAKALYTQNDDIQAIPTPPMKKVVVTLPRGMTLSTSAAQGLGTCSAAEIGLGTDSPVRCPENSRYGALTLHTPILPKDAPMVGDIYIAKKGDNPFHNFLSMYFVIHDESRGLLVKLPGKIDLDPKTGQITTTFDDLPQFPVSDMELTLKSGVRAALVNPSTCGEKTITATFYSWADPNTPKTVADSYDVTEKPDGSPCVNRLGERPFKPQLSAGTISPAAGSYSPFVFRLTRTDDDQEFSQLATTLPPGLLAKIGGISECPQAGIEQAESPGRTGNAEQLFPSCPASSQLGTTDVGSGVGQVITYIPGKAYLAGPYRGAPLSMVVITPILAGPYDLGVIAVRTALHVDRSDAQVTAQTDPLPQIYQGIPVRLRDIRVKIDRPETIVNPTNCDPMAVSAHLTGTGEDVNSTADDTAADLSERFQAANCASLGFKPKLSFKLKGGTKRGSFPALQATLRARPGDANIARSTVVLPGSEFIEQGHIRTVCTRLQFAANQCPAGSIYGTAKATSPLFDEALQGPVYLRSNGGERLLPDLVVSLNGKIDVVLAGFIDSVKGRVRNTFDVIPNAPVTRFTLSMQGGHKGLLVNHRDLCIAPARADVRMVGQNGKTFQSSPAMGTSCSKAKGKHKRGKR